MKIDAKDILIKDIFSPDKKYKIPRYQRAYSWETEDFETLWEDITETLTQNENGQKLSEYFIGSIVLASDSADADRLDIIDGQQRLEPIR